MSEELKSNISNRESWLRLLSMILFGVFVWAAGAVCTLVIVVQFLFKLFTGSPNERLAEFGDMLGAYIHQVVAYLTFRSDVRPYPFAAWPQASSRGAAPPSDAVMMPPQA